MKIQLPIAIGAAAVLLAACGDSPDPQPTPAAQTQPAQQQSAQAQPAQQQAPQQTTTVAASAGDAERGKAMYVMHCVSCHGVEGRGDGPVARALRPPPSNLAEADLVEDRVRQAIRDGGPAVGLAATMPAFSRILDAQQLNDVVAYTLSLQIDE